VSEVIQNSHDDHKSSEVTAADQAESICIDSENRELSAVKLE